MKAKPVTLGIVGVMSMIFGLMISMYSTFRLEQTGYYLSDMRLHIVVTHPYLGIGAALMFVGILTAIMGLAIEE